MFVCTFSDIVGIVISLIFVTVFLVLILYTSIKQHFCKHEKTHENMRCHEICRSCGKDLGFIGRR